MSARYVKAFKIGTSGYKHREHRSKKGRRGKKDHQTARVELYKIKKEKLKNELIC